MATNNSKQPYTPPSVKDDLLSNQLANEPTLREESFGGGVPKEVLNPNTKSTKHHNFWKNLVVPAAAILILLALGFGGYAAWRNANQQAKDASVAERFGSTTFDLNNLGANGTNTNPGLVVIHGNEVVNGSVTANSFSGNGSGLTGVNAEFLDSQPGSFYQDASNLDSGTLNDARLSGNVVLLGDSPSFGSLTVSGSSNLLGPVTIQNILLATGAVTFQSTLNVAGDVTIGGDTNINGLSYAWPDLQGNGVLSNDGSGNLAWQPVGACATCLTDGGNAFGSSISIGTNDANSLMLKTNGNTQLTIDTTGQVGVGLSPGYKLDVDGDINVSAGNAFRIGGTAICTSGGCAASAGSTDYVQNSASLQTGVNFNFEIASVNSVGGIIRAKAGQVSDLQQWQNSGGVALAYVDAAGDFSANAALKINGITVCTAAGCTAAGGSGSYIQNGTVLQTSANFNIQSAAAGSVGGIIRGAVGQTASLLQLQNSGGTSVASFGASGGTILGATTSGAGSLQVYATPGSSLLAVRDSANSNAVVFGVHITGDQGVLTIGAAAHDYLNGATRISGVSGLSSYFNNAAPLGVGTATVAGTVQRFGVYSYTTVDNAAASIFATGGAANKGIVIQGAASQTANLQEWQNSSGTQIAAIDASGRFVATTLGSADTTTYLCRNSTNQIASCSGSSSGAAFVQGGNSFGATATLGTNDANGLAFETNNTVRVTIPSGTNGFTFGAAGDTNLYRLAAGTLATDSILSVRDATDTYVNINPNGTITLAETLGPTSATLDYSHLGFSDSTSYVQIGSSTATTGALRLVNNSNIAWRNAANSANFTLGLNSSNVLETTASIWVNKDGDILYGRGGAGQLRTALNYSGANEVLTFSANGVQGMRVGNNGNVFIGSGAIGITQGSVEKLRVTAAPTTVDNAANAIFVSSATTSKPLVIQGVASQAANLFETQNSSGVVATSMTAAGVISTTLPGGVGQKITISPTLDATYGYQMQFDNASGNQKRLVLGAGSAIGNVGGFGDMLYLSDVDGNGFAQATQIWGQGASGAGTFTNYTERMRLTAFQFGIGTTTFGGTRAYLSVRTPTTADNAAVTVLSGNATTDKVLVIQGVASQTANLQEWQASTGTALSYIDASGNLSIGSNPNAVGSIKLANGAYIRWTNAAGSGSYGATLNSSDQFVFERDITNATASGSVLTSKVGINASGSFDASARLRVNTLTTGDPSAVVEFATGATTAKGLVIQGVASQSANLQEWQDSSGTILSLISASGNISLGTNAATSGKLNFPNNTDVRWRNVANSGDIGFKLTNSDFFLFGAAIGIGLGNNSSTGSLRLPNAASIGWRNAANSANKLITLNSSDVLDMPGVITVGGSDSTAGQINFFSNTVRIARSASSGLEFYTNSGKLRAELNSSGTLGLNTTSLFTSGTVEKLRVNNITTIDNSANAVFNASDTTSKPLVIQGVSSQTANLQEWQNSSGTVLASVDASGNGSFGGGTFATSGGLRLANNVNLGWRNAGNTGNITAGVNASDIFQVTSPAADGSTVAQFNNAGATNCTVQPGGTGFACSSDERLKTNIMNLESGDATELVNKLQGVSFNWITNPDGQTQVGFVAQDLMKYIPSAVSKDSNGYYVANYSAIIPYLVEAFKKQQSQIDTLKSQNGTSVDVLKTLADAKAVTLSGDLTVGGNVVVKGRIEASSDNTGSVTIPAGQTSVHVALPSAFSKKPKVNLTPEDFVDGQYRVTNITKTGFTIELQKAQSSEVLFDWQAL